MIIFCHMTMEQWVVQKFQSITNGHLLIGDLNIQKAQKSKVRQAAKMLLSLRSNSQTMSP